MRFDIDLRGYYSERQWSRTTVTRQTYPERSVYLLCLNSFGEMETGGRYSGNKILVDTRINIEIYSCTGQNWK